MLTKEYMKKCEKMKVSSVTQSKLIQGSEDVFDKEESFERCVLINKSL